MFATTPAIVDASLDKIHLSITGRRSSGAKCPRGRKPSMFA
jgi:hypothetical protein